MAASLVARVANSLRRCPHNGHLLAAVSGGADSTALLSVCARLRRELGFSLTCFHYDHGIRPRDERDADVSFVRSLCASLEVPFLLDGSPEGAVQEEARRSGLGIEAVARSHRHGALRRAAAAAGASHALIAHNADDRLEQVLIRFLRGSGPRGLALMPESRGRLWRPLLESSRGEILDYLGSERLAWRTDSTNADPSYLRNRIRLRLIPFLDRDFPFWRASVLSLAGIQSGLATFLEAESLRRLPFSGDSDALTLSETAFFAEDTVIREEALFLAMDRLLGGGGRASPEVPSCVDAPVRSQAEPRRAVLSRFCTGEGPSVVDMGKLELARVGGRVEVRKKRPAESRRGFSFILGEPGRYPVHGVLVDIEGDRVPRRQAPCPVVLPVVARSVLPEDRIQLGGRARRCRALTSDLPLGSQLFAVEDRIGIALVVAHRGRELLKVWLRDEIVEESTMRSRFSFLYYDIWGN